MRSMKNHFKGMLEFPLKKICKKNIHKNKKLKNTNCGGTPPPAERVG
jgi:hypothetical protein